MQSFSLLFFFALVRSQVCMIESNPHMTEVLSNKRLPAQLKMVKTGSLIFTLIVSSATVNAGCHFQLTV